MLEPGASVDRIAHDLAPEQALAVFECLHALHEQRWAMYGTAVQQAWRDQLVPQQPLPEFDPDQPF